ncbi:hypothetical protein DD238_001982 [Peronospora effusa]|uniref:Uncharacterized protein n=1 Tax=Peronospora effusa TaxID=542832 RepID=A0A3M6VKG3_9STRA|nr:hypothetical protein DD238_001982 [Peronospora effusa]
MLVCAVIQSRNPCNVGRSGIVVAETQQTLQICCLASLGDDSSNVRGTTYFSDKVYIVANSLLVYTAFVKSDSCFKVRISSARNLFLDGAWFAERAQ